MRNKEWPAHQIDGLIKLGNIYAGVPEVYSEAKALAAYRAAVAASTPAQRTATLAQVPAVFQSRL